MLTLAQRNKERLHTLLVMKLNIPKRHMQGEDSRYQKPKDVVWIEHTCLEPSLCSYHPENPRQEKAYLSMGQDCTTSHIAQLVFRGVKHQCPPRPPLQSPLAWLAVKDGPLSHQPMEGGKNHPTNTNTSSNHIFPPTPHFYYHSFALSLLPFTPPSLGHFTDHPQVLQQVLCSPLLPQPDSGWIAYWKKHRLWTIKG